METFTDIDGTVHKVLGYINQGTRRNFMLTTIEDEDGLIFPQVWESNHSSDETPVWIQRRENKSYTVSDILFHVITGPVGGLNDFDWKEMDWR